jgi:hypothetical protein
VDVTVVNAAAPRGVSRAIAPRPGHVVCFAAPEQMRVLPGKPYPLGATLDPRGVNFALYSENASGVELCLIGKTGQETRIPVRERTGFVWHCFVPSLKAGQMYGYRVSGPYEPERGLRFNPNNLLLDPYAKALDRVEKWDDGLFAYELGHPRGDLQRSDRDSRGIARGAALPTRSARGTWRRAAACSCSIRRISSSNRKTSRAWSSRSWRVTPTWSPGSRKASTRRPSFPACTTA